MGVSSSQDTDACIGEAGLEPTTPSIDEWPSTPLERAFATKEAEIVNEALLKLGSVDQPTGDV